MTMPVNLLLVRHGESVGNVAKRLSENGDHSLINRLKGTHTAHWPLSKKGIEQAKKTGEYLRIFSETFKIYFDRMYVSTYSRAYQTASLLDLPCAEWFADPRVVERDWGELDRLTEDERHEKFKELIGMHKKEPYFWTPPGGESFNSLILRIRDFVDSLHRAEAQNVIVVCHGEVIKAFRIVLQGLTPDEYAEMEFSKDQAKRIHNCQIEHYTRADPKRHTHKHKKRLSWFTFYRPASGGLHQGWTRLSPRRFSNDELTQMANRLSDQFSDIDV